MNQQTRQRTEDQYVMPVEASRRGAHRARVSPLLGALPFVAVAVVVVGVVLLAWTLFGGNGGTSTTAEPAGGVSSAASQPAASGKPAASSAAPKPSASKTQAAQPSKTPVKSSAPASTVDKTLKIVVRNSTNTKGLAAGAATKLKAKGWTINGIPDNYKPTVNSTVFYNDPAQKASALAVARILGIDLVKPDPTMAAKGVTVVLGPDYAA